ncbi:LuxR C-terminal-related transcriptional regulator [Enterobacter sp. P82]|uniref:LuxR C-terminal-related transcriptional regulator n=1 Tax=Enterobacter sp. P82 TaxID=3123033 RepID=UPI00300CD674
MISFVSDNYFLCKGVPSTGFFVKYVNDILEIKELSYLNNTSSVIVAIENEVLRDRTTSLLRDLNTPHIVMLDEIKKDTAVKIDSGIYSSLRSSMKYISNLANNREKVKQTYLTNREYDFFKLAHLSNKRIARLMNISEKTTSAYRIKVRNKLNLRSSNHLLMYRALNTINVASESE